MAQLSLFLMFIVAAATLNTVMGDCSYSGCTIPSGSGNDYCRTARSYLNCLKTNVVDNSDCNTIIKDTVQTLIGKVENALEEVDCGGATSLVASLVLTLGLSGLVYFLTSSQ